ncbi:HGL161Wp [Eremothecium sinecaudum]|uniref:HGL161Wp n=1 Tax=Eremothecium sinecaudum TaxID=45286 RepID=A0A0X8HVH5_9SACH|nr:HGL161Wp [Eremothecium sinecaudum]AMD22179.1 HGL161Wp [Eremothecium sinecaudum]
MGAPTVALFDYPNSTDRALKDAIRTKEIRISVVGDKACGKSSLAHRWLYGVYENQSLCEEMEDIHNKKLNYDLFSQNATAAGYNAALDRRRKRVTSVLDTALSGTSEEEEDELVAQVLDMTGVDLKNFSSLRKLQLEQSDGFILCYDCTKEESFNSIEEFYNDITEVKGDGFPVIICCCKSDEVYRHVDKSQEIELCDILGMEPKDSFFETSAKENVGVEEAFYTLLKKVSAKVTKSQARTADKLHHSASIPANLATKVGGQEIDIILTPSKIFAASVEQLQTETVEKENIEIFPLSPMLTNSSPTWSPNLAKSVLTSETTLSTEQTHFDLAQLKMPPNTDKDIIRKSHSQGRIRSILRGSKQRQCIAFLNIFSKKDRPRGV